MNSTGQMYDYKTLLARRKEEFINAVMSLESVIFYEFVDRNQHIEEVFSRATVQLLDQCLWGIPQSELTAWIKHLLIQQNIIGDYLISFTAWPGPFGKVQLSASYDWIEPLLRVDNGFYFRNLSQTRQVKIRVREGNWEANLKEIVEL